MTVGQYIARLMTLPPTAEILLAGETGWEADRDPLMIQIHAVLGSDGVYHDTIPGMGKDFVMIA
jgi:hypothetical protein